MIIWYLQNAQWVHMEMTVNTTAAPRVVYLTSVKKHQENALKDVHPDGQDLCASKVRCSNFFSQFQTICACEWIWIIEKQIIHSVWSDH